jgi:hypothetical protein
MVVSLVPNFNRAMYEALAQGLPKRSVSDRPDGLRRLAAAFLDRAATGAALDLRHARAVAQARAAGYEEKHIHATSGMIIRPDFYREFHVDRRAERCACSSIRIAPTGIVMFGGHGSRAMRGIARRLDDTQLILICGHNAALADELRAMSGCAAPRSSDSRRRSAISCSSATSSSASPVPAASARPCSRAAGHRRAQCLDHAAGALQRALGARRTRSAWCSIRFAPCAAASRKSRAGSPSCARRLDAFKIARCSRFPRSSMQFCSSAVRRGGRSRFESTV